MKTFINWCLQQEIITKNPFNKFEGFRKDNTQIVILSRGELNNLLKVTKSYSNKSYKHFREYVLLHLLIDGMFRITEALLLSPSDIDHTNRALIIQSYNAKSRKSRTVPLSNKTYFFLSSRKDFSKFRTSNCVPRIVGNIYHYLNNGLDTITTVLNHWPF